MFTIQTNRKSHLDVALIAPLGTACGKLRPSEQVHRYLCQSPRWLVLPRQECSSRTEAPAAPQLWWHSSTTIFQCPTITGYRGHHESILPAQNINCKACH